MNRPVSTPPQQDDTECALKLTPTQDYSYRDTVKHTGFYAVTVVVPKLAGVILLPLYTRYLTPGDYGTLELLQLTTDVLSLLLGSRLGAALFYFLHRCSDDSERNKYLSSLLLGAVGLGAIASFIGWVSSPALSFFVFGNSLHILHFRIIFLTLLCEFPMQVAMASLRSLNNTRAYVAFSLGFLALLAVGNIVALVVFHLGVLGMLVSSVSAATVITVLQILTIYRTIRPQFSFSCFAEQLLYTAPLGVSGLSEFLLHFGDRFFLRSFVSLSTLGVYSLAYKLGMLISLVYAPFGLYWSSQARAVFNLNGGNKIYARLTTYVVLALALATLLLTVSVRPVLTLLTTNAYHNAAVYAPWIAAVYCLRSIGTHIRSVLLSEKRTGDDARVVFAGALLCFLAYWALIPAYHLWGAVLATGVGFSVILFYSWHRAQTARPISFEYLRIGKIVASAILGLVIYWGLPGGSQLKDVAAGVISVVAFPASLMVLKFFDKTEKTKLRRLIAHFFSVSQ